jgi:hypothetical protein
MKHDFFQSLTPTPISCPILPIKSISSIHLFILIRTKTFFALVVSKEDNNKHMKKKETIKTQQHMTDTAGNFKNQETKAWHSVACRGILLQIGISAWI